MTYFFTKCILYLQVIKLIILLTLHGQAFSSSIFLEYIQKIERFQVTNITDYYFSCNLQGRILQWAVNSENLGGFHVNSSKRTVVSKRSNFNYTSTLLSARSFMFNSILVVSLGKDQNQTLDVICTNNINFNVTNNENNPKYESPNVRGNFSRAIGLEHVLTAPLIHNSNQLTHIFLCGTNGMSQQLIVNSRSIGFSPADTIGVTRSSDIRNGIVNIQAILNARQPYQTTSIIFVTHGSDFNITCAYGLIKESLPITDDSFRPYTGQANVVSTNPSAMDAVSSSPTIWNPCKFYK